MGLDHVTAPSRARPQGRGGWTVLAVLAAAMGVFVASEPMYQINDCEIMGTSIAACERSIYSNFGPVMILVLAVPVLLCLAPVLLPRPRTAVLATGLLLIMSVGAWAWMDTPVAALAFFVPLAVLAVLVTIVQAARHGAAR